MSAKLCTRVLIMAVVAVATMAVAMPAAAGARKPGTGPVVHELTSFAGRAVWVAVALAARSVRTTPFT